MKEPKEMLTDLNSTLRSWMTSTAIRPKSVLMHIDSDITLICEVQIEVMLYLFRGPKASESSDSETEPESTVLVSLPQAEYHFKGNSRFQT